MIDCFIFGSLELTIFGFSRMLETFILLKEVLQYSFMISWKGSMKDGFPLFATWFESKRHCFAILVSGRLTRCNQNFMTFILKSDLSDNPPASLRDIVFVALLFRPIKCLYECEWFFFNGIFSQLLRPSSDVVLLPCRT